MILCEWNQMLNYCAVGYNSRVARCLSLPFVQLGSADATCKSLLCSRKSKWDNSFEIWCMILGTLNYGVITLSNSIQSYYIFLFPLLLLSCRSRRQLRRSFWFLSRNPFPELIQHFGRILLHFHLFLHFGAFFGFQSFHHFGHQKH